MLPIRQTLTSAPPTGGICGRVLSAVGTSLIGSALHRVSPPVSLFMRASSSPRLDSSTTMASADFCPDRSRQICLAALALRAACGRLCPLRSHSPGKSAVLHHTTTSFTSRTETNGFAVLCQLTGPDRPLIRFDSLRSPSGLPCRQSISASLRFCSSAHGFRIAFLSTVGRPSAVGLCWCFLLSSFLTRET